ncbi:MAG TPA: glycerol-3-phosphate acyltransferase, partial [Planctomycetota bacterium]|nr:glycerol-3-phosphate acyltransferase [Planctomycetota bacterium]
GLYFATRTVSIASLGAAAALPILVALLDQGRPGNGDRWVLVVTIGLAALIFIRHRANIVRLLHGEELRFAARKREEAP